MINCNKQISLALSRLLGSFSSILLLSFAVLLLLHQNANANFSSHTSAIHAALTPPTQLRWQTITIKHGDSLDKIFTRLGLSKQQLQKIIALQQAQKTLTKLHSSQKLQVLLDQHHDIQQLSYSVNDSETLIVSKHKNGFKANITHGTVKDSVANKQNNKIDNVVVAKTKLTAKSKPISELAKATTSSSYKHAIGTVKGSLYSAIKKAGAPAQLATQLIAIFENQVDLNHKIRSGDRFHILYESKTKSKVQIVAAEVNNRGKSYQAIRFIDTHGHVNYYRPDGSSLAKSFLRNPVAGRLTSGFSYARLDPILQEVRPHEGVDFAAPIGTPIKAAGSGKVVFIGQKGGYGHAIVIQHDANHSTLYAHMHDFAKGLHTGSEVELGEIIGHVGNTGMSTGPHLHYGLMINGVFHDPLKANLPTIKPLSKQALARFNAQAHSLLAQIKISSRTRLASNTTTKTNHHS